MSAFAAEILAPGRAPTRVRHDVQLRLLDVAAVERVTPRLVRVTLGGEQLRGFNSPGFDDHVKVFVPSEGEVFDRVPKLGPGGPVFETGASRPAMRDYTPHNHDPAALILQIDFALHHAGPATAWAVKAKAGARLILGGPRSSFLVGTGYDWHLLVGDETALPAIRRRLAELPAGTRATVFAEVEDASDEQPFMSQARLDVHWVRRSGKGPASPRRLVDAVMGADLPPGYGYCWVACESSDAKLIRVALLQRGVDRRSLKAAGYWRRGAAAAHDVIDDGDPL